MKISPINFTQIKRQQTNKTTKSAQPTFTSLYADARPSCQNEYGFYTMINPEFGKVKLSATRIFRELPSEIGISKLIDGNKKTRISVLGCSDGSEAYAYAIIMKERFGDKAKENIKIKGVDISPQMIEFAKTGRIICSDIEREYANQGCSKTGSQSPLKGECFDKYLIKSRRPDSLNPVFRAYPFLKYTEFDPVAKKSIGNGLEWYEINKEGLPDITFETGDMREHFDSDKDTECEVYVIANSGGYLMEKSEDEYIGIFEKIKKANEGKNKDVYVVVGDVENTALDPSIGPKLGVSNKMQNKIRANIKALGFEKVSEHKLRKRGVENYKDAGSKIYKLR